MGFARSRAVIPTEAKELKTKGFQLLFFFPKFQSILARVTEIVTKTVIVMNALFGITIYIKFLEDYLL